MTTQGGLTLREERHFVSSTANFNDHLPRDSVIAENMIMWDVANRQVADQIKWR